VTAFGLLLRLRLRTILNAFRFARPRQRWIGGLFLLGGIVLFGGLTVVSGLFFTAFERLAGPEALRLLGARTVEGLFVLLLAGGVPFVSGVLFTPGDLPLLAASPISGRAVTLARLLDGVVVSSAQFVFIGLPLAVAFVGAVHPPVWGWALALLALLLLLILPAVSLAALLLATARVLGVRRVKLAVALVSAVLAVGLCFLTISGVSRRSVGSSLPESVAHLTEDLKAPAAWMPSTWIAGAILEPEPARALGSLLLALAVTGALVLFCLIVGPSVLLGEGLLEGGDGAQGTGWMRIDALLRALRLPASLRAILAKDLRFVFRDLVLLSQIGIPMILYGVPFLLAGTAGQVGASAADLLMLSVLTVTTVAYMASSILGLSSLGLEGRAFWLVLASPVSVEALLLAKWMWSTLLAGALTVPWLLLYGAFFGASGGVVAIGTAGLTLACGALCGLGVGLSGLFPRFVSENPAHRASVTALLWGFVGASGYMLLAGGSFALALWIWLTGGWRSLAAALMTVFLGLSIATAIVPLTAARRRLRGYAWDES
jgi:ABC-2 type transport system permease protein